ncbi:right-handed parallel beta-helix repeat-containing protein [Acanthopleuribacter pedis]|uniref:Right-handed parallel beta-helix repeat-containing protein n=1 Tax=Acanthopleuribacter pedis TaxID=442870 RepID=A0A8J7QMR4_9BACT|nr:right-handed parallel beta-helix repeat-containing protein [Acanthopleuribacter pedis]MBO1322190.1 right-handed parallel beta-helix repeat-containing protein [Acanthopleuribacter pedis]
MRAILLLVVFLGNQGEASCPFLYSDWPVEGSILNIIPCLGGTENEIPSIQAIELHTASPGETYTATPVLDRGGEVHWTIAYGPDDLQINPLTGQVSWQIPAENPSESFYVGVRATNRLGSATEYWIVKVGGGNILWVGPNETHHTLAEAFDTMQSGDTLVIRDGVYPVSLTRHKSYENAIVRGNQPPPGTAEAWTTVMAENPTGVLLDASDIGFGVQEKAIHLVGTFTHPDFPNTRPSGVAAIDYLAIKGLVAGNTGQDGYAPITVWYGQYLKFELCGAYDAAATNTCTDSSNWGDCNGATAYFLRSQNVLVESCFAWGHGRYYIQLRNCSDSIIRRSVVRLDEYRGHQPRGGIIGYSCRNVAFQNNMIVDGDSSEFWTFYENHANLYGFPATDDQQYPENLRVERCLAVNSETGFSSHDAQSDGVLTLKDVVGYDLTLNTSPETGRLTPLVHSVGTTQIQQASFGHIQTEGNLPLARSFVYTRDEIEIDRSIFYRMGWNGTQMNDQGPLIWAGPGDAISIDDSLVFDYTHPTVAGDGGGNESVGQIHTMNPTENGWRYLPRIEADSPLTGTGAAGSRVGASVETYIGKSGSLFSQAAAHQETNRPAWPVPAQELFRDHMAAYSYTGPTRTQGVQTLSGARGFCAQDTNLTHYIWEYMGDLAPPMPVSGHVENGVMTLLWNPASGRHQARVSGFRVYLVGDSRQLLATLPAETFRYEIRDYPVGSYRFQVTAVDGTGNESGAIYTVALEL